MAASVCWAAKPRARSRGPISALYRPTVVSIVRTQSPKRLAFTVWAGGDDVADLDCAISDNHTVDQQFEQRPLSVKVGTAQAFAHMPTKRLGMGGQASRLALTRGVMHKLMLLSIQRLQSAIGIAPTALVLGQRHCCAEIGVREPLELLTEGGATAEATEEGEQAIPTTQAATEGEAAVEATVEAPAEPLDADQPAEAAQTETMQSSEPAAAEASAPENAEVVAAS